MKASELRIGNYVQGPTHIKKVGWAILRNIALYKNTGITYKPIPLTELWFEKFGFKSIGLNGQVFEHKNFIDGENRFIIETDCNIFYPKINFNDCYWGEFKYVHQLQNLYFALTGEELLII